MHSLFFAGRRERVSTGAIVGGVIGGILAVCILSIIIVLCIYQHRRHSQNSQGVSSVCVRVSACVKCMCEGVCM